MRKEDKKIYCWLNPQYDPDGLGMCPNYSTMDGIAITLLPVLVEKGHGALLTDDGCKRWDFTIWIYMTIDTDCEMANTIEVTGKPSISEAITAAVLQLIAKESGHE